MLPTAGGARVCRWKHFATGNRQTVGITGILPDAGKQKYGGSESLPILGGKLLKRSKVRRPAPANVGDGKTFVVGHLRNFREKNTTRRQFSRLCSG
jgi:hypothetical protein